MKASRRLWNRSNIYLSGLRNKSIESPLSIFTRPFPAHISFLFPFFLYIIRNTSQSSGNVFGYYAAAISHYHPPKTRPTQPVVATLRRPQWKCRTARRSHSAVPNQLCPRPIFRVSTSHTLPPLANYGRSNSLRL